MQHQRLMQLANPLYQPQAASAPQPAQQETPAQAGAKVLTAAQDTILNFPRCG